MSSYEKDLREVLLERSRRDEETGCLLWTGGMYESGFGRFRLDGKWQGAHRVAYSVMVGEIPKGYYVRHTCNNKHCIEPSHLVVGPPQGKKGAEVKKPDDPLYDIIYESCVKCGQRGAGVRYDAEYEVLELSCKRCGYVRTHPCLDAAS